MTNPVPLWLRAAPFLFLVFWSSGSPVSKLGMHYASPFSFLAVVRHGRAAQASALFYLVPPVAAVMAWVVLGEPVPTLAWAGMVVAGLGVVLVRWQKVSS